MKHDYSGILHFFRTGQLGELRLGMRVDEVVDYLGEADTMVIPAINIPEWFQENQLYFNYSDDLTCLTYGCLKLHFEHTRLKFLQINMDEFPEQYLPASLDQNWIVTASQTNLKTFWEWSLQYNFELYSNYRLRNRTLWQPLVVLPLYIKVDFYEYLLQIRYDLNFQLSPHAKRWIYTE